MRSVVWMGKLKLRREPTKTHGRQVLELGCSLSPELALSATLESGVGFIPHSGKMC